MGIPRQACLRLCKATTCCLLGEGLQLSQGYPAVGQKPRRDPADEDPSPCWSRGSSSSQPSLLTINLDKKRNDDKWLMKLN